MDALHIMIVEDEKTYLELHSELLTAIWEEYDIAHQKNVHLVNFDEASKIIQSKEHYYDIVILDLLDEKRENRGLDIIYALNVTRKKPIIIVITQSEQKDQEKAKHAGVHYLFEKDKMKSSTNFINEFYDAIYQSLLTKNIDLGLSNDTKINYSKTDYLILSLIETIGINTLMHILIDICKTKHIVANISSIKQGLSGATVLKADCLKTLNGNEEQKIVLIKISSNKNLIMNEFKKLDEAIEIIPKSLLIEYYPKDPSKNSFKDYYYLAAPFQLNTDIFLLWLENSKNKDEIERCLKILFMDRGYKQIVNSTKNYIKDRSPFSLALKNINTTKKAKIMLTIEELEELVLKYDKDGYYNKTLISDFLERNEIKNEILILNENSRHKGAWQLHTHGDMHSRNLLVDINGIPYLIDIANIGYYHWASDYTRFMVDIFITGIDNTSEQHEWNKLNDWIKIIINYFNDQNLPLDEKDKNYKLFSCLNWLQNNYKDIFVAIQNIENLSWEFTFCIAIEFLRSVYRHDISTPKRVTSIICACYFLRKTIDEYEKYINSQNWE